jgi:transposase
MSRTRRSFTTKYKVEADHRVIGSGTTIAEVARELGVNEGLLGRWVADERRRVEAAAARNDVSFTPAVERTELPRLPKQVAEQGKGIAFLKKWRTLPPANRTRRVRTDGRSVRDQPRSPESHDCWRHPPPPTHACESVR